MRAERETGKKYEAIWKFSAVRNWRTREMRPGIEVSGKMWRTRLSQRGLTGRYIQRGFLSHLQYSFLSVVPVC